MPIVLFSWETDSIVFDHGIPHNLPDRIRRDDHWWVVNTFIASVMAYNIIEGL